MPPCSHDRRARRLTTRFASAFPGVSAASGRDETGIDTEPLDLSQFYGLLDHLRNLAARARLRPRDGPVGRGRGRDSVTGHLPGNGEVMSTWTTRRVHGGLPRHACRDRRRRHRAGSTAAIALRRVGIDAVVLDQVPSCVRSEPGSRFGRTQSRPSAASGS